MEILWQSLFQIALVNILNLLNDASFNVLQKLDELWILDPNPSLKCFFVCFVFATQVSLIWNYMNTYDLTLLKNHRD